MTLKSISFRAFVLAQASVLLLCANGRAELFDPSASRGLEMPKVHSSPDGLSEICLIAKPFSLGFEGEESLSEKALEQRRKLCELSFYDSKTVACPKLFSTNPGVEIQKIDQEEDGSLAQSREEYFETQCKKSQDRDGKKLAKFKQSISCSYTPSILTYPYLNLALGDSLEIPAAVVRTMSLSEHKKITAFALKYAKDTIALTWQSYRAAESNPSGYSKKERLYTTDFRQIYGALVKNPGGEERYTEINKGLNGFLGSQGWSDVKSSAAASDIAGRALESAAQRIVRMKDISNMLVMDYIMGQQDRFGNIHAIQYFYSLENGEIKKRKRKDDESAKPGEILVKEMLLKDNDCGMRSGEDNKVKSLKLLEQVRHMAPKNYRNLQRLAASVSSRADFATYLQSEMLMTRDDVKQFTTNLKDAARILKELCVAKKLRLDLDLEALVRGETSNTSCE